MSPSQPIHIRALAGSPIECGSFMFRHKGQLRVAAIVKTTYSLVPGAVAAQASPSKLVSEDLRYNGHPQCSVRLASDLAPYRPRVDVTFVGYAYAPRGASSVAARLAVVREHRLIDKIIHVYGDGDASGTTSAGPGRRTFDRMPLVYEKAVASFGQAAGVENPIGAAVPNLVDPANPKRPASFGPIARDWPGRARLLGGLDPRAFDCGVAEIPDAFDWRYFQTAPPDQQLEALRGDEWLVLEGVHPTWPRIQTRLSPVTAVARVDHGGGNVEILRLTADTLAIDGERLTCDVVWRGNVFVPGGEPALPNLSICATLTASHHSATPPASAGEPRAKRSVSSTGTVAHMTLDALQAATRDAAAPFPLPTPGTHPGVVPEIPGTPWSGAPVPVAPPVEDDGGGTLILSVPPVLAPDPSFQSAGCGGSTSGRPAPRTPRATVAMQLAAPLTAATPFATATSPPANANGASEVAGTPWAQAPLRTAPKISDALITTLPLIEAPRVRRPSDGAASASPAKPPEKRRMYGNPNAKKR